MANLLIEKLPKIIAQGKKEAERILEVLSKSNRIKLQTNELVLTTNAEGEHFGHNIKTDCKTFDSKADYTIRISMAYIKITKKHLKCVVI